MTFLFKLAQSNAEFAQSLHPALKQDGGEFVGGLVLAIARSEAGAFRKEATQCTWNFIR
jgi:hypothetical protein